MDRDGTHVAHGGRHQGRIGIRDLAVFQRGAGGDELIPGGNDGNFGLAGGKHRGGAGCGDRPDVVWSQKRAGRCHQGAGASIFRPTTDMPVGFGHCCEMYFVGEVLGWIVEVFQRDNRVSAVGHRGTGHNGGRFTGVKCFVLLMPGRNCFGDRQGARLKVAQRHRVAVHGRRIPRWQIHTGRHIRRQRLAQRLRQRHFRYRQRTDQMQNTCQMVVLGGHVRLVSLFKAWTPPSRYPTTSCPVAAKRWAARIERGPDRHRVTSCRPGSGRKASRWSKGTSTVANGAGYSAISSARRTSTTAPPCNASAASGVTATVRSWSTAAGCSLVGANVIPVVGLSRSSTTCLGLSRGRLAPTNTLTLSVAIGVPTIADTESKKPNSAPPG